MEQEAQDRDRTLLACAAQNAKLLPPQKKMKGAVKQQIKSRVSHYFED